MSKISNYTASTTELPAAELCRRFGVSCLVVGDVHKTGLDGKPIAEADLKKWMVTTPARAFPTSLIRSIPLAETQAQCQDLAARCLMLRHRDSFLMRLPRQPGDAERKSPAIPTATYLAFIMDPAFWPSNDREMVYATDLVIEVDGVQHEQHDIEPATFKGATEVVIVAGEVYEEFTRLHSVRDHFESWIIGHRPLASGETNA